MKMCIETRWLRGALRVLLALLTPVAVITARAAINGPPPTDFSVQPEEDGKLVYSQIAAASGSDSPFGLFWLGMNVTNNGATDLTLTNIQATFIFPIPQPPLVRQFDRAKTINDGAVAWVDLTNEVEMITLPASPPSLVYISLFFDQYTQPKTKPYAIAPYVAPVPGGSYVFHIDEADLGPDEYVFASGTHGPPDLPGEQFWGHDLKVAGWNAGGTKLVEVRPGGSATNNADFFGFGVPIRAMADGVVISASTGWEENPMPDVRAFQRMADYTAEAITDVKVARLSDTRAASVARLGSGNLKIIVWDLAHEGREINLRGSTQGEAVRDFAVTSLTETQLVTAVRLVNDKLRVILWEISTNGLSVTRGGEHDAVEIEELSLAKLSSTRFATGVRTRADHVLRLIVWEASADGQDVTLLNHAFAGTASSIATTALGESRLVTSLQTAEGNLKVIVWDLLKDNSLKRRGEGTNELITKVVAAKNKDSMWVTAMRTAGGNLKLLRWETSEDGMTVKTNLETVAEEILDQSLAISPVSYSGNSRYDNDFVTAVLTPEGNYRNIGWSDNPVESPGVFVRSAGADAGVTDHMSIDATETLAFFSAVRTESGNLKIITWWWAHGGGNCLRILHGNCVVLYAHMKDGSVRPEVAYPGAPVAVGQILGQLGNTGSAGSPHTHIHSERVPSNLSAQELIDLQAQDALPIIGTRPFPFRCARATAKNSVQPGGESNPANSFSSMHGHGVFTSTDYTTLAIRPGRKTLYVDRASPGILPTGDKEGTFIGPLLFGGPYHTVQQALDVCCWGNQLFIRVGTYPETVRFDRSMTVRSYDGTATINPE